MVRNLSAMGADIKETADGMIIRGGNPLHGAVIDSRLDHRIAMSFSVAACLAEGETEILGAECKHFLSGILRRSKKAEKLNTIR